jgi:uncharacterized membrane protein HdeD (DUF308 family)
MIVAAIFTLVDASSVRSLPRIVGRVLLTALHAIAGVYLLLARLDGTITLTVVLIALFLAEGAFRVYLAIRERDVPGRGTLAFSGVLSIIVGLLIWLDFPSSPVRAIGMLVGINLIFWGVHLLAIGWLGRTLAKRGT